MCRTGPLLQVGHDIVKRLAYPRHLRGAHAVDAQGRGHALHLPRGNAAGHHFRYRGDNGPIDPRVASEHGPRGSSFPAQLGDAQVYRPHTGDQRALAVAVAPVAVRAGVLGLRVHYLIDERLGHDPD